MFISPKNDCFHIQTMNFISVDKFQNIPFYKLTCKFCNENKELWICLTCGQAFCSRYVNNHYQTHFADNQQHCICISLIDLSIWCYSCSTEGFKDKGSYIENEKFRPFIDILSKFKFGEKSTFSNKLLGDYFDFNFEKINQIKYTNFIELLKNNKFKNISFLLGAGISTTAGIPDFRSENGIFATIKQKFNINRPEDLFSLDFFQKNPLLLYTFLNENNFLDVKPKINHYFMKYIQDKGKLDIIFTQNFDNLESKSGIDDNKIVFCHGSMKEAHCSGCNQQIDIADINNNIKNKTVKYCNSCHCPCKPKIILYGEALPQLFYKKAEQLFNADVVFIIGTSLNVEPFASLTDMINHKNCWIVLINKMKVGNFNFNDLYNKNLFIEGLCDDIIKQIIIDCDWWDDFNSKYGKLI